MSSLCHVKHCNFTSIPFMATKNITLTIHYKTMNLYPTHRHVNPNPGQYIDGYTFWGQKLSNAYFIFKDVTDNLWRCSDVPFVPFISTFQASTCSDKQNKLKNHRGYWWKTIAALKAESLILLISTVGFKKCHTRIHSRSWKWWTLIKS